MLKRKEKQKKLNQIHLLEEVKVLSTNDLMYIKNIVVYELRKRGVKHVWGSASFLVILCWNIKGIYTIDISFWYCRWFIMEVGDLSDAKLYIPSDYDYSCCYISGDNIYCLKTQFYNTTNERDIFNTRLGYISYSDSVYIGSSFNYTCIDKSRLTNDVWYRVDLHNILTSFLIIILIPSVLMYLIHKRFKKR